MSKLFYDIPYEIEFDEKKMGREREKWLKYTISLAYQTEFYREKLRRLGLTLYDINNFSFDDLKKISPLTRSEMRKSQNFFKMSKMPYDHNSVSKITTICGTHAYDIPIIITKSIEDFYTEQVIPRVFMAAGVNEIYPRRVGIYYPFVIEEERIGGKDLQIVSISGPAYKGAFESMGFSTVVLPKNKKWGDGNIPILSGFSTHIKSHIDKELEGEKELRKFGVRKLVLTGVPYKKGFENYIAKVFDVSQEEIFLFHADAQPTGLGKMYECEQHDGLHGNPFIAILLYNEKTEELLDREDIVGKREELNIVTTDLYPPRVSPGTIFVNREIEGLKTSYLSGNCNCGRVTPRMAIPNETRPTIAVITFEPKVLEGRLRKSEFGKYVTLKDMYSYVERETLTEVLVIEVDKKRGFPRGKEEDFIETFISWDRFLKYAYKWGIGRIEFDGLY